MSKQVISNSGLVVTEIVNKSNANFTELYQVETSVSNTIVFDSIRGYRHGTWDTPITGTITLDDATAVEGACAVMIWRGSSNPTFSGGTIQSISGVITELGTYSIYFHYINSRININVFNVDGSVDITAPVLLSATIEDADPTDIVMVFSEAVTGTNLGFTIAGTTSTSFSSISGSGTTTITGVLGTSAATGETITLDYSSSTGDLEDSSGNVLASFTGSSVTNNIAGIVAFDITPNGLLSESPASSNEWLSGSGGNWNGYGVSDNAFSGDFEFEILVDNITKHTNVMFGMSLNSGNVAYNDGTFPWEYVLYENTTNLKAKDTVNSGSFITVAQVLPFNSNDKLTFKRASSVITLEFNGSNIYTFPTNTSADLYLHIAAPSVQYVSQPKAG